MGGNMPGDMQFGRENAQNRRLPRVGFARPDFRSNLGLVRGDTSMLSGTHCQYRYPSPSRSGSIGTGPASLFPVARNAAYEERQGRIDIEYHCDCTEDSACLNKNKGSSKCVKFLSLSQPLQSPACRPVSTATFNAALPARLPVRWLPMPRAAMSSPVRLSVVRPAQPATISAFRPVTNSRRPSGRLNTLNRRGGMSAPAAVLHEKDCI